MKPLPPFQVIYQTAEDGLGDTVKPRLIEAEADLDRVLVIDEAKRELTLSDERIEKAITQNGARLITAIQYLPFPPAPYAPDAGLSAQPLRPRRKFQSRGNLLLSSYNITHLHCIIHISPMECCYMHVN